MKLARLMKLREGISFLVYVIPGMFATKVVQCSSLIIEFMKIITLCNLFSVKPEILKNVGKAITTLPENFKLDTTAKFVYEWSARMIKTVNLLIGHFVKHLL